MAGRIYSKGEKPHSLLRLEAGPNAFNRYFYARFGVVLEVDYDRYEMEIMWLHQDGARARIPISFPQCGPSSIMGMLPEKGAIGIFNFYDEGGGKGSPVLVGYLTSGLSTALDHNVIKILPEFLKGDDENEVRHRLRKLGKGDMACIAPDGAGLFLNDSVELYDGAQDIIQIREGDQAILQTSLSNYIFADGASVAAGPAVRNGIVLYDTQGNRVEGISANSITLPSGKEIIYVTPRGADITEDSQMYTEYRIDVDEFSDGRLDLNDINGYSMLSSRDPIVTLSMGNLIGANKKDEYTYGKIIRPILFNSANDQEGAFNLVAAVQNNGIDEPGALGMSYALNFPKSGSFLGMDKEGQYYMVLGRSKANPSGAGRSMSVLAQGNLKEIWGADSISGNAWDLTAKGGIRWRVGSHNTNNKGRSVDIRTESSVYLEISGEDEDGFAKQEIIAGDVNQSIGGTITSSIADQDLTITGMKTETVRGAASLSYQSDLTVNVAGVSTENVISEKQCKFGKRKTTITTGNDELVVLAGNIDESIKTVGKRSTTVTSGSIEDTVLTGNIKSTVTTGNYKVNVVTGGIEIATNVGSVTMKGTTVSIKGQVSANVEAPMVKVGNGAAIGGVVSGLPGLPNHFDYVTGAPLKGSNKVSVG